MMSLDLASYHSTEANREYLSNSQYKDFMECAAKTKAILDGKWVDEEKSKALMMGSYVDNALLTPERLPAFIESTKEFWFKRERKSKANPNPPFKMDEPKADKETCDRMVARCQRDKFFMLALQGQHQVIVTWEMFGVWFKAMMDVADPDSGYFCDLKTCAAFDQFEWSDFYKRKVPFYEKYWSQFGAFYVPAYTAKFGKPPTAVVMAAVTKQDPPDIDIWSFDALDRFQDELSDIEQNVGQVMAWKTGKQEPRRCGSCDYCRHTKVLGPETVIVAENPRRRGTQV